MINKECVYAVNADKPMWEANRCIYVSMENYNYVSAEKYLTHGDINRKTCYLFLFPGVRVLEIGGSVVIDLTWFRLHDLARASVSATDLPSLLENVLEGITELPTEPEQEYQHITAENR